MKAIFFRLTAISLLFLARAHADLTGTWSGTGSIQMNGSFYNCLDLSLVVIEKPEYLQVKYGYYLCPPLPDYTLPFTTFNIEAEHLLLNGQTVGKIDRQTDHESIHIELINSHQIVEVYDVHMNANTMTFDEQTFGYGEKLISHLKGNLARKP